MRNSLGDNTEKEVVNKVEERLQNNEYGCGANKNRDMSGNKWSRVMKVIHCKSALS